MSTIFLDSNIVLSGLFRKSTTRRTLVALRKHGHTFELSPYVRSEVKENVASKFPELADEIPVILGQVEIVPDAPLLHRVPLSEKDKPVLAAAISSGSDYLLTGDRDFHRLLNTKIIDTIVVDLKGIVELLK